MKSLRNNLALVLFVLLLSYSGQLNATVKLPRLISNGMVLQRDAPLKIWGWADPSEKVNVEFLGKKYQTKADKHGNWKVDLPAIAAGGPYNMKINEIETKDILMGDVWLCSGQSNMELPVNRVMDKYADEIEGYENTSVRYVKVPYSYDFSQQKEDIRPVTWRPMTTENVKDFSAICYFFSRLLEEKANVPVGIINASWGGTPVEAWVSEKGLQNFPEGFAVSMPLRRQNMSRLKSFWYGQLSAIVEPIAAVIGAWAVFTFQPILPYALAFAAGAMIFVVVEEVIPETQQDKYTDLATMGFIAGFIIMMSMDVGLS